MQYGTATRIVKPGDRKSLSFYVEGITDYLNDTIYTNDSFFDGACIKYFFIANDEVTIPNNIKTALNVELLTAAEARDYLRSDTNMEETNDGFLYQEECTVMNTNHPAQYIVIS